METSVVIHKLLGVNVSVDVSHVTEQKNVFNYLDIGKFYMRFRY